MSTSWEPLPSIYRSKQEFLASLPPWRRLLQKLNWHPTVELKVQRYELEQRMLQMRKEDERLKKEDERLKKQDELRRKVDELRRKEDELRRNEDERLRKLDERFDELNAKLSAILSSSDTSSTPPNATPGESEM
jgi:predicted nuclease with TOPRIM domain